MSTIQERQATEATGGNGTGATIASRLAPAVGRLDRSSPDGRPFAIGFWDGSSLPPTTPDSGRAPTLRFTHPDGLARVVWAPGELGLARAWVAGELEVEGDLELALRETEDWRHGRIGPADALAALGAIRSTGALRRGNPEPPEAEVQLHGPLHSADRDREAIAHHYDASNSFYRLMLGPTMVYSCAYFDSQAESLEAAQTRKLDLICRKLDLRPGQRMLDIGCGWGSLMVHAANNYGARCVGVTLSAEQAKYARQRIEDERLGDRCEVRLEDYRMVHDGPYDRIASVGMFEHVGRRNLKLYFERAAELLTPDGLFLNHGIVRTEPAKMSPRSFTQRYVFPDGELHTQAHVIDALEGAGFELLDDESLRPHYAKTLRCWDANLEAHREAAIREIGEERERVWRLHNIGAALAFDQGRLSVHQALSRPLEGASSAVARVRVFPATASGLDGNRA